VPAFVRCATTENTARSPSRVPHLNAIENHLSAHVVCKIPARATSLLASATRSVAGSLGGGRYIESSRDVVGQSRLNGAEPDTERCKGT